jgi:S-adenosylmethionine:tRNA ribosyltransferase-isomerase
VQLSDFDYDLPPELIAQEPVPERSHSRLLRVDRQSGSLSHHAFFDLGSLLPAGCLLVLNDTRVFPARLHGQKESGGRIEVLLVHRLPGANETWEVLCKGGQNVRVGARVHFAPELPATWRTAPSEGRGILEFFPQGDFTSLLERFGEVPLPPYIKRTPGMHLEDRERYQTVYARHSGAIAAPTAGLHFTPELLNALQRQGVETAFITLHIGAGTFQPVRVEQVEAHTMEEEEYEISAAVVRRLHAAKKSGRKIVAVGTTTTRALESACDETGMPQAGRRRTALFIYPGFRFQAIDGLITNFHLPCSTLLMLVSAFAERELILKAYAEAVAQRYRFYSYGDAMLIV